MSLEEESITIFSNIGEDSEWMDIKSGDEVGEDFKITFEQIQASKVKWIMYTGGTYGPSIYEFSVYGWDAPVIPTEPLENMALNKSVIASSTSGTNTAAKNNTVKILPLTCKNITFSLSCKTLSIMLK